MNIIVVIVISATALHGASLIIAQACYYLLYYCSSQKLWRSTSPADLRKREK